MPMPPAAHEERIVLSSDEWASRMQTHERRVDGLVRPHLERRRHGEKHPVEDFLFTYYSHRPAQLRRWHPGAGVALAGDPLHESWPGYVRTDDGVTLDPSYVHRRIATILWVHDVLETTSSRPAFTGCLGLHEWAMVYRSADIRHRSWPLRLGAESTDAVVDAHQIHCTHFDAFRHFTGPARPRNIVLPTRERQLALEQPGCLHANMDLYKWAYKLSPLIPSELVADAFVLAREIRELDMRASPYDLSMLGYEPVAIETAAGRREYTSAQRAFSEQAAKLRRRLLAAIAPLTAHVAFRDGCVLP